MHTRPIGVFKLYVFLAVLPMLSALPATAQGVLTDPPNASPGGGQSATGSYTLDNIESVNSVDGNVNLRLPVAHLPAGPGGFSAGVSLVYNSAIFDVQTLVPVLNPSVLQMSYVPSVHGGGWNYSYKYTLWSQTRVSLFSSATCGAVLPGEAGNWYKTILATPDGANHALRLVGALDASGNPYNGTLSSDTGQSYALYDFAGYTNLNCGLSLGRFSGTLIFASADSTYLRVEANTVTNTWKAFFPNGTQITGPAIITAGHAVDSDAAQIVDRNGNTLDITGNCAVGTACTETLTDGQSRTITMSYASNASGTWRDDITWPGPNANVHTYVNWNTGSPYALPYYCQTGPTGVTNTGYTCYLQQTASFVNSVQMPPASTGGASVIYKFGYSPVDNNYPYSWGELHLLTLCTGTDPATCQAQWNVTYRYAFDALTSLPSSPSSARPPGTAINPIASKTLSYMEFNDITSGTQNLLETTSYIVQVPAHAYTYPVVTTISANQVTYPDGSFAETFTANLCPSNVRSRDLCVAVPYKILNRDNSITEMMWVSNTLAPGVPAGALFNPHVQYRVDTPPGSSVSRVTKAEQDQNGNTLVVREYDWLPYSSFTHDSNGMISGCSSCTELRTTTTSFTPPNQPALAAYWTRPAPAAPTNLRIPYSVTTGSLQTSYTYDGGANLLEMDQTDSGATISSHWTYGYRGNVASATDPNSHATQITYGCNSLYPSRVVAAGVLTTDYTFDCASGYQKSVTDYDNTITTAFTYDNIGRTTKVEQTASGFYRATATAYDDVGLSVTTTRDTGAAPLVTTTWFDAPGRVHSTMDAAGHRVLKLYRYGSGGVSYELTSNPYTGTSVTGWTLKTTTLNASPPTGATLSKVTVTGYDGSAFPAPWGTNSSVSGTVSTTGNVFVTGCTGAATQITDAANNVRTNCMDGLGRLAGVIEPDGTLTSYSYDAQNNLTSVSSHGQPRTFTYSLSRLMSATNPETGLVPVSYTYDNNGNVMSRHDGNRTNSYAYDALNRLTGKCYGTSPCTAPSVVYSYDQPFKGALSSVNYPGNSSTAFTYDALGRISTSTQITASKSYPFSYTYTLADQLLSITYPSGRKIDYGWDSGDQVTSVSGTPSGGTSTAYASGITYTAAGDLSSLPFHNGITETHIYNSRLQPTGITAGSLLSLGYNFCPNGAAFCATGNTGTPRTQTIGMAGLNLTQTYTYDNALNRLTAVAETGGPAEWSRGYGYDATGNQYVSNPVGLVPQTLETPLSSNWFSSSSNQVSGWTYNTPNNVGQLGQVGQMARNFVYDAEDRQVTATINGTATTYTYDGDGNRVMKTSGGQSTVYVYDAFGNLAAEYATQPAASPCVTQACYLTADHLGSTRLVTDTYGNAVRRYDYEPFGTEIPADVGGRTTGMGFLGVTTPDSFNLKFTGQERDSETGLDYFHARYYSAAQGRFQGPDPGNAGADLSDPQTWNGYAYVGNNPLTYTDPSGLGIFGDIGSIIGSFFPGLGTLIGWGIGSIADLATGQSISPPGVLGAGINIVGTIAGGVNNGQPWNEQLPAGVGGMGRLNTGTVFGSGNTGPFIFSFTDPANPQGTTPGTGDIPIGLDIFHNSPQCPNCGQIWRNTSQVTDPRTIAAWYGASAVAGTAGYLIYDISQVHEGLVFGTRMGGNTPLLNSAKALRIGWSYSRQYGQYVFRIGGTALGKVLANPHINLWPPSWWGGPPKP